MGFVSRARRFLDPDLKPGGLDPDLEIVVSDLETSHFRSKNNSLLIVVNGIGLGLTSRSLIQSTETRGLARENPRLLCHLIG